jgi:myosin heavy subunit
MGVVKEPPYSQKERKDTMKQYTKNDFLDYATAFNYDLEGFTDKNGNSLSDNDIKKLMKSWTLQEFQDWFGFTHLDSYTGDSK